MRESVPSKVIAKCRHSAPAYAHKQVLTALQSNDEYTQYRREHGEKAARFAILGPSHQLPVQARRQGMETVREHPDDGRTGGY